VAADHAQAAVDRSVGGVHRHVLHGADLVAGQDLAPLATLEAVGDERLGGP
jgi:hypothetical protein